MSDKELRNYVSKAIENTFKELVENPKDFFDNNRLQEKYNNLYKENINLKQALNEIREYVEAFANLDFCTIKVTMLRPILEKINEALGDYE